MLTFCAFLMEVSKVLHSNVNDLHEKSPVDASWNAASRLLKVLNVTVRCQSNPWATE